MLVATLEELVEHGLQALRETLQQDKELTINNTSLGIVGPGGADETYAPPDGSFRILAWQFRPVLLLLAPTARRTVVQDVLMHLFRAGRSMIDVVALDVLR